MFDLKQYLSARTGKKVLHNDISKSSLYKYYQTFECHANPLCYFSAVIDTISMIIIKFQLDYTETISVLRAFAAMPSTVFYFVKVLIFS